MKKDRIPKELFREDGHYLGRPADFDDRIISRRLNLVRRIEGFTGNSLTLLDIGCGNGASMFQLSHEFTSCDGFEISEENKPAFEHFKTQNNIQNCTYSVVDVTRTRPPKQWDRIISFEVIEHLETEQAVQFYADALKSGGLMAISVPNKWWIFETHGAKLPLLPWNRVPLFSWLPTPIHERYANARIYTKKRIVTLLERFGFEILSCDYVTAPMDVLPAGAIKDWLIGNVFNTDTTQIPFKATSLFVAARKK